MISCTKVNLDVSWNNEWFFFTGNRPSNFWTNQRNLRLVLENFAKKKNILNAEDWSAVTTDELRSNNILAAITNHYGTLKNALQISFPGINKIAITAKSLSGKKSGLQRNCHQDFGYQKKIKELL